MEKSRLIRQTSSWNYMRLLLMYNAFLLWFFRTVKSDRRQRMVLVNRRQRMVLVVRAPLGTLR